MPACLCVCAERVGTNEARASPHGGTLEHLPLGPAGPGHVRQPSHDAPCLAAVLLPLPRPLRTAVTVSLLSLLPRLPSCWLKTL